MSPGEVCGRKVVYYTKTQARKAAKAARLRYHRPMYFYRCSCCGWYHLTSRKEPYKTYTIKSAGLKWRQ